MHIFNTWKKIVENPELERQKADEYERTVWTIYSGTNNYILNVWPTC